MFLKYVIWWGLHTSVKSPLQSRYRIFLSPPKIPFTPLWLILLSALVPVNYWSAFFSLYTFLHEWIHIVCRMKIFQIYPCCFVYQLYAFVPVYALFVHSPVDRHCCLILWGSEISYKQLEKKILQNFFFLFLMEKSYIMAVREK